MFYIAKKQIQLRNQNWQVDSWFRFLSRESSESRIGVETSLKYLIEWQIVFVGINQISNTVHDFEVFWKLVVILMKISSKHCVCFIWVKSFGLNYPTAILRAAMVLVQNTAQHMTIIAWRLFQVHWVAHECF